MRLRELAGSRVRFGYRRLTRAAEERGVDGERKTNLSTLHRGRIDREDQATQEGSQPPARTIGPSGEAE